MSKQYNNNNNKKIINTEQISDNDEDFETEIGIGRKQLQTIINELNQKRQEVDELKAQNEVSGYKYSQTLNDVKELSKQKELLTKNLETYKSKNKNIKDTDLKLYNIDVETKKKNYDKRVQELMKEAQREIEENRKNYRR